MFLFQSSSNAINQYRSRAWQSEPPLEFQHFSECMQECAEGSILHADHVESYVLYSMMCEWKIWGACLLQGVSSNEYKSSERLTSAQNAYVQGCRKHTAVGNWLKSASYTSLCLPKLPPSPARVTSDSHAVVSQGSSAILLRRPASAAAIRYPQLKGFGLSEASRQCRKS